MGHADVDAELSKCIGQSVQTVSFKLQGTSLLTASTTIPQSCRAHSLSRESKLEICHRDFPRVAESLF
jgi:hypothetical protein